MQLFIFVDIWFYIFSYFFFIFFLIFRLNKIFLQPFSYNPFFLVLNIDFQRITKLRSNICYRKCIDKFSRFYFQIVYLFSSRSTPLRPVTHGVFQQRQRLLLRDCDDAVAYIVSLKTCVAFLSLLTAHVCVKVDDQRLHSYCHATESLQTPCQKSPCVIPLKEAKKFQEIPSQSLTSV